MAGHKVRCRCGFVFRLGSKSEKQPGVAEDIQRRRAIKARKMATHQNAFQLKKPRDAEEFLSPIDIDPPLKQKGPVEKHLEPQDLINPVDLDDLDELLQPIDADNLPLSNSTSSTPVIDEQPGVGIQNGVSPDDQPLFCDQALVDHCTLEDEPEDSILETNLSQPKISSPSSSNQARFKQAADVTAFSDLEVGIETGAAGESPPPTAEIVAALVAEELRRTPESSPPPLSINEPIQKPSRKSAQTGGEQPRPLNSTAGPIASLTVAILGAPVMILLTVTSIIGCFILITPNNQLDAMETQMASSRGGGTIIFSILFCLIYFGLALSIIASGITAVIEMVKKTRIGWGHRLAAIIAAVTLVFLFFNFVYQFGTFFYAKESLNEASQSEDGSLLATNVITGAFLLQATLSSLGQAIVPFAVAVCGLIRSRR